MFKIQKNNSRRDKGKSTFIVNRRVVKCHEHKKCIYLFLSVTPWGMILLKGKLTQKQHYAPTLYFIT